MLEVGILRVLFLQAINRRTPCSPWIPVSPKLSGRPSKATYHHGPPTCTHWAATGCASRTGTASKGSSFGWSPAAHGTSQPGSVGPVRPPCAAGAPNGWPPGSSTSSSKKPSPATTGSSPLDLSEVAVHGSLHKAPCGGEGTGPNPTDRAKIGWKWSVANDLFGIPIGWVIDAANRNDSILLEPTLQAVADRGLLLDIETLHLDRGYDSALTTQRCHGLGLTDIVCAKKKRKGEAKIKKPLTLGLRWPVERTNSWFSNFGQLRRNTDRFSRQRLGQVALAVALILTVKLVKWVKRWTN
jgi:hypothetical protein